MSNGPIPNFKQEVEEGTLQPSLVLLDGTIVNGWKRYRQAKREGVSRLPVVVLDLPVEYWTLDMFRDPYADVGESD